MRFRIYINNQWIEPDIDTSVENVIALNYTFESLSNPTKYVSEYSYNINLPKTAKNCRLFENINVFDSTVDWKYYDRFIYLFESEGDVISKGTCYLNEINEKSFVISLAGELTTIFQRLLNSGFDESRKDDEDYKFIPNLMYYRDLLNGNYLNAELVKQSFEDNNFIFDWDSYFQLRQPHQKFTQTAGFLIPNFNEMKNFTKGSWAITGIGSERITPLGSLTENAEGWNINEDDINSSVMAEIRCYHAQPYIYITRLWQIYKQVFKNITNYNLDLDSRWFNETYYPMRNMIYVLPKLDTENTFETNQSEYTINQTFTLPFTDVEQFNFEAYNVEQTITASRGSKGIFEFTIPMKFRSYSFYEPNGYKYFNRNYIPIVNLSVTDGSTEFGSKTIAFCPTPEYTDDEGNLKFKQTDEILTLLRNYADEVIEYSYTTKISKEDDEMIALFGYLNGRFDISNISNAYCKLNLSFLNLNEYYSITNSPLSGDILDIQCTFDSNMLIDSTLMLSNGQDSKINLTRLLGKVNPFQILLKFCKMNNLIWFFNDYTQTVKVVRKYDYFFDCLNTDMSQKHPSTYPYKGFYDISRLIDKSSYKLKPLSWTNRNIAMNFDIGNEQYGKAYKDRFGITYGSKLIHTVNKTNNETEDLFNTSDNDRINPCIFSAEFIKPLQAYMSLTDYKVQDDSQLCYIDNCFCYRNSNSTYNVDNRSGYKVDNNGAFFIISNDTDLEFNNNTYCWHYYYSDERLGTDVKTYTRPVFSEANKEKYCCLFALPYEIYNDTFPSGKSELKYLYDEQFGDYFNELYNPNNKVISLKIKLNPELFIRLKTNPLVMIGNIAYLVLEIFDYKGTESLTQCTLRQISNINSLITKATYKTKLNRVQLNNGFINNGLDNNVDYEFNDTPITPY